MANQLYAAPIIIEAFQTGKGAMRAEYEVQSLNEPATSPNNGPFIDFSPSPTVRLDKGVILIAAADTRKHGIFCRQYSGVGQIFLSARNPLI
jgi:hypothetical protein